MDGGPKVFISHTGADHSFVEKLAADLERDGVTTWVDEGEIRVGESITGRIAEGLADADFLLLVLSRASLSSGWVQTEWAALLHEQISTGRVRVLVCKVDECEVPILLRDRRYASFTSKPYEEAYGELLEAVLPEGPMPQRMQAELVRLTDAEPAVRRTAAEYLGHIADPRALDALGRALRYGDCDLWQVAMLRLGGNGDPMDVAHIARHVAAEHSAARQAAARALGEIGDPRAVGDLVSALNDDDCSVCIAAAYALGCIGDEAGLATVEAAGLSQYLPR